jgi:hypothetical protein
MCVGLPTSAPTLTEGLPVDDDRSERSDVHGRWLWHGRETGHNKGGHNKDGHGKGTESPKAPVAL